MGSAKIFRRPHALPLVFIPILSISLSPIFIHRQFTPPSSAENLSNTGISNTRHVADSLTSGTLCVYLNTIDGSV
ncbi:hypothetical protein L873DRAFT_1810926 [Choiromyces venosus 120613-1]|uniref:Uncharacterized protein n=1 Tax=Choiromyces venosus 120613-1 TaxID=1336337 RepID=A0A3N4JST8_9PEZI|nr:hypothetical protein L873DRAFT_1810926 [Choiromyces venosus 120613-1]